MKAGTSKGVTCKHCAALGTPQWVTAEGDHHKAPCPRFRACKCFSCRSCEVVGTSEWVTAKGNHHALNCGRRSFSLRAQCKHCDFVGEPKRVTEDGRHHELSCPRYSGSTFRNANFNGPVETRDLLDVPEAPHHKMPPCSKSCWWWPWPSRLACSHQMCEAQPEKVFAGDLMNGQNALDSHCEELEEEARPDNTTGNIGLCGSVVRDSGSVAARALEQETEATVAAEAEPARPRSGASGVEHVTETRRKESPGFKEASSTTTSPAPSSLSTDAPQKGEARSIKADRRREDDDEEETTSNPDKGDLMLVDDDSVDLDDYYDSEDLPIAESSAKLVNAVTAPSGATAARSVC